MSWCRERSESLWQRLALYRHGSGQPLSEFLYMGPGGYGGYPQIRARRIRSSVPPRALLPHRQRRSSRSPRTQARTVSLGTEDQVLSLSLSVCLSLCFHEVEARCTFRAGLSIHFGSTPCAWHRAKHDTWSGFRAVGDPNPFF